MDDPLILVYDKLLKEAYQRQDELRETLREALILALMDHVPAKATMDRWNALINRTEDGNDHHTH